MEPADNNAAPRHQNRIVRRTKWLAGYYKGRGIVSIVVSLLLILVFALRAQVDGSSSSFFPVLIGAICFLALVYFFIIVVMPEKWFRPYQELANREAKGQIVMSPKTRRKIVIITVVVIVLLVIGVSIWTTAKHPFNKQNCHLYQSAQACSAQFPSK